MRIDEVALEIRVPFEIPLEIHLEIALEISRRVQLGAPGQAERDVSEVGRTDERRQVRQQVRACDSEFCSGGGGMARVQKRRQVRQQLRACALCFVATVCVRGLFWSSVRRRERVLMLSLCLLWRPVSARARTRPRRRRRRRPAGERRRLEGPEVVVVRLSLGVRLEV